MRAFLIALVVALLFGAFSVWLMQQDSGYILITFNSISVEMTIWVGLLLYLMSTFALVGLFLVFNWMSGAGGFRQWWREKRSNNHINKTKQGLILFADHEWHKATDILSASAEKSVMPEVNLLFAARAAGENGNIDQAKGFIEQLRYINPKSKLMADKTLAEIYVREEKFTQALELLEPIAAQKPEDSGILRLLADVYYLTNNWNMLQKLLDDLRRFKAISKADMAMLELDVYQQLLIKFKANIDLTEQEQIDQVADIWELIPNKLKWNSDLICSYFDALQSINKAEKLVPLMIKSINNHWNIGLVSRFGHLETQNPQLQLAAAEKWLKRHPDDSTLLESLGDICCQLRFWGKARDYFASALSIDPSPLLHSKLGEVLSQIGEFSAAQDSYKNGLVLGLAIDVKD